MFTKEQNDAGRSRISTKDFPPSLQKIERTDKIAVDITLTTRDWIFLEGSDLIKRVILCIQDIVAGAQIIGMKNIFNFFIFACFDRKPYIHKPIKFLIKES